MKLHEIVQHDQEMSSMLCIFLNQGIFCTLTTLTVRKIVSQPILSQYSETEIILMAAEHNMTHTFPILSFRVHIQNEKSVFIYSTSCCFKPYALNFFPPVEDKSKKF